MNIFNLLIASSDLNLIESIRVVLSDSDIESTVISNWNDLFHIVLDQKYNLLVLDNQLSEMSGSDVLPMIKKIQPKLPIIYIADKEELSTSKKIASSGVIIRLIKSYDNNELYLAHIVDVVTHYKSKEFGLNSEKN